MYNLLVSNNVGSWNGANWQIELSRCVREYTEDQITERFGQLDAAAIVELKRLPCIFAYEAFRDLPPKFGRLREIVKRQGEVRIEYQIEPIDPFLSAEDLESMNFELDIARWEMNRTHWAVKEVDLPRALHARGIVLPAWTVPVAKTVDITTYSFDVALSFPGEVRPLVEQVAKELESLIGPNSYFYDNNYVSQLARPSLDTLLQGLYRHRAKLIVVFLSSDYQRKDWCGIEFRAIREIIFERDHNRIMFIRTDDGTVEGVFKTDGYVDARKFSPAQIAQFIVERVNLLVP